MTPVPPDLPTAQTTDERYRSFLAAILDHGLTMWSSSARGLGVGGQTMTSEAHPDVIQHLVLSALNGRTLAQAADTWEQTVGRGTRRLDGPPGRTGRRGPDGRPL